MAAAAGKPDLKKQLLEQLDKVKPDDRLNFLVNRLVNLESDGQRLVECVEAHRKETERANQVTFVFIFLPNSGKHVVETL